METDKTITLEVQRYLPEEYPEPFYQQYEVPLREKWVILDALNYIKDRIDGTLSFRWSCRMGVCGSCGMMVNDTPVLTCAAFLEDYLPGPIRIDPLSYFDIIRDLVVETDGFMEKLKRVKPWLITDFEKPLSEGEYLQTPEQKEAYHQYSMCINCMLCYAACPVVGLEPEFVGPAAIALSQRYNYDSRDEGTGERNEELLAEGGIYSCTLVGECSEVCPKAVDPAGAIQRYKVRGASEWWKSVLVPWGDR
ncbi:MAG: succinate dehydrogenase iron-sulfur subunit [Balneolaceae bacterium]|nr:succinate dehydrogenase iron-sulfur subunit [Balneolaceae bacterium]